MTRLQPIEHFVVLMLENCSFDNLLPFGQFWRLTETPGRRGRIFRTKPDHPGELWQDYSKQG